MDSINGLQTQMCPHVTPTFCVWGCGHTAGLVSLQVFCTVVHSLIRCQHCWTAAWSPEVTRVGWNSTVNVDATYVSVWVNQFDGYVISLKDYTPTVRVVTGGPLVFSPSGRDLCRQKPSPNWPNLKTQRTRHYRRHVQMLAKTLPISSKLKIKILSTSLVEEVAFWL